MMDKNSSPEHIEIIRKQIDEVLGEIKKQPLKKIKIRTPLSKNKKCSEEK
jgi:hypothetical protein